MKIQLLEHGLYQILYITYIFQKKIRTVCINEKKKLFFPFMVIFYDYKTDKGSLKCLICLI